MIPRYSRPEMGAIWTDENKLNLWLQIEMHASEAETVTSNYLALSANEREALLFFLNDL